MSNNTRWSSEDFKKQGLIEVNGAFVKASTQVAKGKVDKLPNLIERAIKAGSLHDNIHKSDNFQLKGREKIGIFDGSNFKNSHIDELINVEIGEISKLKAEQILKALRETGSIFVKTIHAECFKLPDGSYIDVLYSFDISPVSAPRMTQSDKWKLDPNHIDPLKRQRKPVEKYFKFKQDLLSLCDVNGYNLTERLNILFVVPMPDSWSKNKRYVMNNQPHKQRPDRDNYLKAFQDSFKGDDGHVWDGRTIKLWGAKGRIIIF